MINSPTEPFCIFCPITILTLAVVILMGAGCATIVKLSSQIAERPRNFQSIQIDPQSVTVGEGFEHGRRDGINYYPKGFIESLCQFIPIEQRADLALTNVKIDIRFDKPRPVEIVVGFLSTFTPGLPLVKFPRDATCVVTYSLKDATGTTMQSSSAQETICGYYYGWSFTRLNSVSKLQDEQRLIAIHDAARMVAADLFAKVTAGQIHIEEVHVLGGALSVPGKGSQSKEGVEKATALIETSVTSEAPVTVGGNNTDRSAEEKVQRCPTPPSQNNIPTRLKKLKELKDSGAITESEYEFKRQVLVEKL